MQRSGRTLFTLIILILLIISGCAAPAAPAPGDAPAADSEVAAEPTSGGTLTIARPTDAVGLDPKIETTSPGNWVMSNNYENLVKLDTDLTFHLIDLMLGGDHAAAPIPITRSFTSIDMALCRLPLETMSTAFMAAVASCFGRPVTKQLAITAQRQDITQVRIAPDYVDVLVYNLALDIGEAARAGNLRLVLPLAALDAIRAAVQDEVVDASADQPHDLWRVQMRRAAATAPVVIDAVLHRQKLTIAALEALRPGDLLEIPAAAPDEIQLMVAQPNGRTAQIAAGKLGVFQGTKVIKLDEAVDRRVRDQLQHVL